MYIQERKYELCRSILQLPGIVHSVMGALLQFYYRQCYFNIIYNQLWNCVHNIGNHTETIMTNRIFQRLYHTKLVLILNLKCTMINHIKKKNSTRSHSIYLYITSESGESLLTEISDYFIFLFIFFWDTLLPQSGDLVWQSFYMSIFVIHPIKLPHNHQKTRTHHLEIVSKKYILVSGIGDIEVVVVVVIVIVVVVRVYCSAWDHGVTCTLVIPSLVPHIAPTETLT